MPSSTPKWTPAQQAGITTTGQGLLLSAAAGSGKTAVLTERCVYLVCDAPAACEIDEILVVAFNEAAAAEMKGRIHQSLNTRFVKEPTGRLEKQVALAERAAISTLHAFCSRLLRQHFHRVGLDPNFTVIDADEALLMRRDIARRLFEDRYADDASGDFQRLIDHYGDGDDGRIIDQVLKIHALLTSVISPETWRAAALSRLITAASQPLQNSELGKQFLRLVADDLRLLEETLIHAMGDIKIAPYLQKLNEWLLIVRHWKSILANDGLDALADEIRSIESELKAPLPRVASSVPDKEKSKATMDGIKKHLNEGFIRHAGLFTQSEWRNTVERAIEPSHVLLELVDQFDDAYQQAKSQQRSVDFSDLERFTLRILSAEETKLGEKPSDVARALQKRFKHVLVDEYQDINEVQDAILRLVSRESSPDPTVDSNLFCVGDVKQSIYRFRLAEPRRFLQRYEAFKSGAAKGRVIDLQENFRSRGPLLEALNDVFRVLMTKATAEIDYDQSHELRPSAGYPAPAKGEFNGRPIELHLVPAHLSRVAAVEEGSEDSDDFDQDEYEAALVATRILHLTGRGGTSEPNKVMQKEGDAFVPRDIRLGDIVILLRGAKFTADHYADILRRWGIPAHADSRTGFFESQEIRDVLALLQVLDNQRQDIPLASVLRGPIGRLSSLPAARNTTGTREDELATIRLAYPDKKIAFHEAVARYAAEKEDATAKNLRERLATLKTWREMIHQRPVAEVLRHLYDETGLLAYYAGLPDGDQRVANLEELYERAAQFGTFAKQGLARFLRFLENLERDSDLGQPSLDAEAGDVVRIMTIHQSKGLEFPVVILPNLGRRFNRLDSSGSILADRRSFLALHAVDEPRQVQYPSMASVVLRDTINAQTTAEEIRILYVALTRAKEHLVLVGSIEPKAIESAASRWADHTGPLPVQAVRGGGRFLDWLLPIASRTGQDVFDVRNYEAEEILAIASSRDDKRSTGDGLAKYAALKPLPKPATDEAAAAVLERLRFVYPHQRATTLAAARSVTSWTKKGPLPIVATEPETRERSPDAVSTLELPLFLAEDVAPKATDLGTFTHVVLEKFDFAATAPPLEKQIAAMVDQQILTDSQARLIDRESIEWFLQSDLGRRIRDNAAKLHRELPLNFAASEEGMPDRADQIMLRGRLDAFLDLPAGGVVIDYKTDRVSGPTLPARIAFYEPQLRAYLAAMSDITRRKVTEAYLVFLNPREIARVSV